MSNAYKILVVEDEHSLAAALKDKLSKEGFLVIEAKNGEEGLEAVKKESPDLILLDIVMPKMDGLTMLEKCREELDRDVPVIMLTNLSDKFRVAKSLNEGAYDYLIKSDWSLEDIVKRIKEKLNIS